jgi:hypothetical protein
MKLLLITLKFIALLNSNRYGILHNGMSSGTDYLKLYIDIRIHPRSRDRLRHNYK